MAPNQMDREQREDFEAGLRRMTPQQREIVLKKIRVALAQLPNAVAELNAALDAETSS